MERFVSGEHKHTNIDVISVSKNPYCPMEFLNTRVIVRNATSSTETESRLSNNNAAVLEPWRRLLQWNAACRASSTLRLAERASANGFFFVPRFELTPSDTRLAFSLHRQLPVGLCYCMTVNKVQSQTLDFVGLYLPQCVFSHSLLYVDLSRVGSANRIKVSTLIDRTIAGIQDRLTRNIVHREILHHWVSGLAQNSGSKCKVYEITLIIFHIWIGYIFAASIEYRFMHYVYSANLTCYKAVKWCFFWSCIFWLVGEFYRDFS